MDRPNRKLDNKSYVNLPLLKGLLQEVRMELATEDFLYRSGTHSFDPTYKSINIFEEDGFDNYGEIDDHDSL